MRTLRRKWLSALPGPCFPFCKRRGAGYDAVLRPGTQSSRLKGALSSCAPECTGTADDGRGGLSRALWAADPLISFNGLFVNRLGRQFIFHSILITW